jgi:hypothetical protein
MRNHELCRVGSDVDSALQNCAILDFRLGVAVRNGGRIVYVFGQIVYIFGSCFFNLCDRIIYVFFIHQVDDYFRVFV